MREDGREGDVQPSSAPNATTPREGHRSPRLDRARRLRRGPRHLTDEERLQYAVAENDTRHKLCSTAHTKVNVVKSILAQHPGQQT